MIICLKGISEKCFLFNVNVNASLKFPWALEGLSEYIQTLGHLGTRGTFEVGTLALGHSEDTQRALKGHPGT